MIGWGEVCMVCVLWFYSIWLSEEVLLLLVEPRFLDTVVGLSLCVMLLFTGFFFPTSSNGIGCCSIVGCVSGCCCCISGC